MEGLLDAAGQNGLVFERIWGFDEGVGSLGAVIGS